jgi:hypothetical protein
MIYAIAFDGVLATRDPRTRAMRWLPGAEAGLTALLDAEHDVIVWSEREGPAGTDDERVELRMFLAVELSRPNCRIASAEVDGPKPVADVYVDAHAERFNARDYPGSGLTWLALAKAGRRV